MAYDLKDPGSVVETSPGDDGIVFAAPSVASPRPAPYKFLALWAYIVSKAGSALTYDVGTAEGDVPALGPSGKLPSSMLDLTDLALTGTPTAPTAAPGTNTTQISTTAFVQAAITALINSAPGALDTLDELAAALGDDGNFATTVTNALALKAPLASPTFTGTPAAPSAAAGTSTTQLATTEFVQSLLNVAEASLASAGTCDIGAVATTRVEITGTTTITSLGTGANKFRVLRFAAALTLTHNATTLILPGAANIATEAGDVAIFASDGSGNWRCVSYLRASGTALNLNHAGALVGSQAWATTSVASAGTTDLGASNAVVQSVTGTTTITSFGASPNRFRIIVFAAALTLTHNATTLILPTGANITTAAGDVATAVSDGSGNWRVTAYTRADGSSLGGAFAVASQAEAEAATDNSKGMTPLRTQQQLAVLGHAPDVIITDQKTQNTSGGTFNSGAWQTRTLNTVVRNRGSIATLSSNQVTLPAGSYVFRWSAPAAIVDAHQSRLYNVTDAAVVQRGSGEFSTSSGAGSQNKSVGVAFTTIASSKAFRIEHWCVTTGTTNGFGGPVNITNEVFTILEITKVSV